MLTFVIRNVYLAQRVNRAYHLSSTTEAFERECDKLRNMFTRLCYPHHLIESTTYMFNQSEIRETPCESHPTAKLPFKSQQSAEQQSFNNNDNLLFFFVSHINDVYIWKYRPTDSSSANLGGPAW